MAEDLIQNYIDHAAFAADTKFALEQLALLQAEYNKLKDFRVNLNTSLGTKDIVGNVGAATTQVKGLTKAIAEQTQVIGANARATKAEILSLEQNISLRSRLKNTLESVKKDDKENLDLLKQRVITQDEYRKRIVDAALQQEKLKIKISDVNKELKSQIALQNTPANTIARAQAENKQLTAIRNVTPTNDTERIAQLNTQIDRNNNLIDLNSDKLAKQKINIGNYQGAANSIVDALGKQEGKLQSLSNAYTSFGSQIAVQKNVISGFKGDINSTDYKKATAELVRLENEYKRTGTEVNKTRTVIEGFRRAADISSQQSPQNVAGLNKTSAAYTATSQALNGYVTVLRGSRGPTKLLGETLGIGATQADTFRLVIEHSLQGIAAYFRSKKAAAVAAEESAAALTAETAAASTNIGITEAQVLAQTNLAAAQGATAITTQAEATAQAELDILLTAGIASAEAQAAAQANLAAASLAATLAIQAEDIASTQLIAAYSADTLAATAATGATTALAASEVVATGATTALGTALKFSGIGLIVAAIALLVYNLIEYIKIAKESKIVTEAYSASIDDFKKSSADAVVQVEKVGAAFSQAKEGVISKDAALKIYNDTLGDAFGKTTSLLEAEKLYTEKAGVYIKIMGLKAQANALFTKSAEETAKGLVASQEDQVSIITKLQLGVLGTIAGTSGPGLLAATAANEQNVAVNKLITTSKQNAALLEKEGVKISTQAELLAKQANISLDDGGKKDKKGKKEGGVSDLKAQLDTEFEIYKLNQARLIELYKEEANDPNKLLSKRLDALNSFFIESKRLIGEQEEFDKQAKARETQREIDNLNKDKKGKSGAQVVRIDENIKVLETNLQQELLLIEAKGNDERNKAGKLFSDTRTSIVKSNGEKIKKIIEDTFKDLNAGADKEFATINLENEKNRYVELQKLDNDFKAGKIKNSADYEKQKSEIEARYNAAEIQAEINKEEEKRSIAIAFGNDTVDIDAKILQLKLKQLGIEVDATKKAADAKLKIEEELAQKKKELLKAGTDLFIAIVQGQYDREKNRLADAQTEVDKNKERQLAANEAIVQSEEKKAANIIIINTRAQVQKEALDRSQKKLDRDKAVFERAAAVFNIGIATVQAVAKIKLQAAVLLANPITAALAPLALSQIPISLAIGALEIAALFAKPIPKFKTGKNNDYEGPAIVGDGGVAEYIERADGSLERTPSKDTLTYLGKDDIVYPNFMAMMLSRAMPSLPTMPNQIKDNSFNELKVIIQAQYPLLNQIANKRENHLSAKDGALVSLWKHGANQTKYFDENTNW